MVQTQTVILEGEGSSEVPVTSGVPQGSVLGPLLFLHNIKDLPQKLQSQVRLFADDTAVYLTVCSPEDTKNLQSDLDFLQEWESTWDMEFNPSKCQVLHITRSRQPLLSQYTLHGQVLEKVSEYDQEIPQSQTAEQPTTLWGRATGLYSNNTSKRQ